MSARYGDGGGSAAGRPGSRHETGGSGRARRRPGGLVRALRGVAAGVASLIALLLTVLLLGAYLPGIPGVGVIGAVLGGQYPFHLAVLALAAMVIAGLVWWTGLVRYGRALTTVTAACTAAALFIAGVQLRAAAREDTDISWGEVFTEVAYPDTAPDETTTFARFSGQELEADVYLPGRTGGPPRPAVVLAHAGGFRTFDKSDLRGTGRWLAAHGVAAFAVDYRLSTPAEPTWNKAPQDVVCALAWVRENADRFHVSPSRISLAGMSAGGALALGAAYRLADGSISSSCGSTPAPPASVIGFYPAEDLHRMWSDDPAGGREAATWFTGGTPQQYPARYRLTSPARQIRAGLMPTLLVVGDRDRSVPSERIRTFGTRLARHGVDAEVKVLPYSEHAFDDAYGSVTSQTSRRIMLRFLTAHGT